MKPSNNIAAVIFIFLGIVTAFSAAIPNKVVPPKFKNLKVLPKNISEAALDKIMDDFNYSLGVTCDYCHAKNEKAEELKFESDAKPEKNAARKMMLMTFEINIKHFGGTKDRIQPQTIKCITCHHQKPYPQIDSAENKKEL
jgi:Photosynthetic reaction centre cytochrome C subunit